MYQVCYDVDFMGRHEVRVCYETDSEHDAQCYIRCMYSLGDYSNYHIREVKNDNK